MIFAITILILVGIPGCLAGYFSYDMIRDGEYIQGGGVLIIGISVFMLGIFLIMAA